jgi:large subunit ribosomal protein L29
MEIEKIRNLSDDELKSQQMKSAEELFRLRFRMKLGNPEGVKKLRGLKLDIARIHTVAREREMHIERAAKPAASAKASTEGAIETAAKKAPAKNTAAKKTAAKKASSTKASAGAKKPAAKKATKKD